MSWTMRSPPVLLIALAAGLALPASAAAERCTFGFDQDPRIDRHPGACERNAAGGRTAAPIAAARDGRVWFFVRDDGVWRARRASFDGGSTATAVTTAARPTGLTRGPDGALWYVAGDVAGRIAGDGSADRFDLDTRATGGIVTGSDDNLWYVARTAIVRLTTDGEATAFGVGTRTAGGVAEERSARRPDNAGDEGAASGITAGPDGAVWFSAYGSVGRMTPDGDVRRFDTILPADGGIAAGPAGERAIYYTSFDATDVVRIRLPDGAQQRFGRQPVPGTIRFKDGLTGRPVDIVAGAGRFTLWATLRTGSGSSIAGEKNIVARIHSTAFRFGRPPGEACDPGAPASCGSYMPAWPIGYSTSFNTHEIPEGGLVAAGDDVWYPEGRSLGRIRAFRGIMKCTTTDPGQTERAAQRCASGRSWVGDVNARGVTVARMSCPRLTLRYCAGHVTLSSSGVVIGGGDFIYQSYDNPAARLTLNLAGRRKLARIPGRRLTVTAILESHDAGGLEITRTEPLLLVQSETPDLTRSPFRYIDHGGAPRVVVTCQPADGNGACGPVAVHTRDVVKLTLKGVRPRAGRVIEWDLNGDGTYENRDPHAFEQVQGWKVPSRERIGVRVRDGRRIVYRAVRRFVITQGLCQAGDSICRR
jgi:streptogramin lyase